MGRLIGIGFIWFGCAIAWVVLGTTIVDRSGGMGSSLTNEVYLLWGPPGEQHTPSALYIDTRLQKEKVSAVENGRTVEREVEREVPFPVPVPLDGTDASASLSLDQRQKGLLWFAAFGVDFHARYTFTNPDTRARSVEVRFPLQQNNAIFDGFAVTDSRGAPVPVSFDGEGAMAHVTFGPSEKRQFNVAYRSRGTGTWRYVLTDGTNQVRDFKLELSTDFPEVDFPAGTLSPSSQASSGRGWHGTWQFQSLVANGAIGMVLPQKLNPGELASKITFFAPVGLLFFFFVVAVLAAAQRKQIHPLNYFLFGCSFFAFHLLFAYLVDHLAILPAFGVASAVSIFLVVTYARLFVGWGFALREMAISQLVYLVLFSFTFFWSGFTGLAITIGAILTLFMVMQITGRVSWREVMETKSEPKVA